MLVGLVGLGAAQAVLALVMAGCVDAVLGFASAGPATGNDLAWAALVGLVGAVFGVGIARWSERIVAEALGQDYVFEQRRRLVAAALGDIGNRSLGVIVTRASNDLTAVRNWIAQGIVPLCTGLTLIGTVVAVLAATQPAVALAIAVPIGAMALVLPRLARAAHDRARRLRRQRGRMSGHIADTARAGESVRLAGAVRRELSAVDRASARVVDAAVDRAQVTGLVRALTITTASLCTAAVVLLALLGHVSAAAVASAMTLLGVMSTPMADLGRVVEYRQNYRAARRILAPMLAEATEFEARERDRERAWRREHERRMRDQAPDDGFGKLLVEGFAPGGVDVPGLRAEPGDRVLLRSAHPALVRRTVRELLGGETDAELDDDARATVRLGGFDLRLAPARFRRSLVGFASNELPLERGSVGRLIGYRDPDVGDDELRRVVREVGLEGRVDADSRGLARKLKNDGAPWTSSDVARLKLARALVGTPPLLVLEHLDAALDAAGRDRLREILAAYPGIVLVASHRPELIAGEGELREWQLDGADARARERTAARVAAFGDGRGPVDDSDDE
jgi:ABC-type multidrug transport system fused ATPase/permease subunit